MFSLISRNISIVILSNPYLFITGSSCFPNYVSGHSLQFRLPSSCIPFISRFISLFICLLSSLISLLCPECLDIFFYSHSQLHSLSAFNSLHIFPHLLHQHVRRFSSFFTSAFLQPLCFRPFPGFDQFPLSFLSSPSISTRSLFPLLLISVLFAQLKFSRQRDNCFEWGDCDVGITSSHFEHRPSFSPNPL
jgi:hypothetical protein